MSTAAGIAAAVLSAALLLGATVTRAGDDAKSTKVEDAESTKVESQFEIQEATSDLQNAENAENAQNVRSQAEKRLEQQRKDLTRNWGG